MNNHALHSYLMKVVNAQEMTRIEKASFAAGSSDLAFMEAAGLGIALEIENCKQQFRQGDPIILLCGKGNNAGDAYTAGFHLLQKGLRVTAWQLFPLDQCTTLCQRQHKRFISNGGSVKQIAAKSDINIPEHALFLDGIFGTGFQGRIEGLLADVIALINQSRLPVLSIDIPSGLSGNTGHVDTVAIKAIKTIYLGLPKTGFFIGKGWNYVGKLACVNFGLPKEFIDSAHPDFYLLTDRFCSALLPPIQRNRHKYEAGYIVALTGSPGMPGAAILSGTAALRAGAGIVRLWHPTEMQTELSGFTPELIHAYYPPRDHDSLLESFRASTANYIGPGIGRHADTLQLLKSIFTLHEKPCVIDADALTLIAENPSLTIPENCVLTPHKGEMDRLLQITDKGIPVDEGYFRLCQSYCDERKVTIVLKGAPTLIFHPDSTPLISPRGDPGMATAGSGDVLTGIVAAFLAQGLRPQQAAAFGVYLHGIAGEHASREKTSYSVIASDLIEALPDAFKELQVRHMT